MNCKKMSLLFIAWLVLALGCRSASSTPVPLQEALALTPTTSPQLAETAALSLDAPTPAGSSVPLSESGPWLVVITPNGVWALNPDGTGLTQVYEGHILAPQDVSMMPAPTGGTVAFITGDSLFHDFHLNLLTLPHGAVQDLQLIAPEFQTNANSTPGDPDLEAARALVEVSSLAWAPGGNQLAFMAVREGPTSDLYLLDPNALPNASLETSIARLTDTPSQNILPSWSPDGRYILHAGVSTLGTGVGASLDGVWAFDTQTGELIELYTPENSAAETFLGWHDADTFLVYSWTPICGNERLRAVNVPSGESRMIWEGSFNGVAFAPEHGNGSLLISIDTYTAGCKGNVGPGLFYLFGPDYVSFQVLLSEEVFLPVWSPEGRLFFARTLDRVFGIQLEGDVFSVLELDAPAPVLPSTSPFGERLAWALPSGVWVGGIDSSPIHIFTNPASLPIWSLDGQTLFFFAEGGMYTVSAPDFDPQVLGKGLLGTGAFWVGN